MTSCELLGMNTIHPTQMHAGLVDWNSPRVSRGSSADDVELGDFRKLKRLLKSIQTQMTSMTRILVILIVIEFIRMVQA
ncbi:MAG TPA: hypothetical protein V6C97_27865 [Oculatellaceae cyanobacterium]